MIYLRRIIQMDEAARFVDAASRPLNTARISEFSRDPLLPTIKGMPSREALASLQGRRNGRHVMVLHILQLVA